ncbi:MAG: 5-amino-6-(D-ribitylamino)uracil--L-tyrosine 4-hydroxyphenyl transferase CofH [Pseudomonadota bacterium]
MNKKLPDQPLHVLMAVKSFTAAKQRLAAVLSPESRYALARAMFCDVTEQIMATPSVARLWVISPDTEVQQFAQQAGCGVITDRGKDLNQALRQGFEHIYAHTEDVSVLVLHSDLPLLQVENLTWAVHQCRQAQEPVTLLPDNRRQGISMLYLREPAMYQYWQGCHGRNSFQRLQQAFVSPGCQIIEHPQLGLDIDEPDDLYALYRLRQQAQQHCLQVLSEPELQTLLADADDSPEAIIARSCRADSAGEQQISDEQVLSLADYDDWPLLRDAASSLRDRGFQNKVSYSRKVFIPLTRLCRDVCHYCTFAKTPRVVEQPYMSVAEVLELCHTAAAQGCREALFTLGEKPELRYAAARKQLAEMGFVSTLDYVAHVAQKVFTETGLLPHINAGCMNAAEMRQLRKVSASMGLMLESASARLCEKGQPHYGSPDKNPQVRLETLRLAGEQQVPFTTGILIGIGETRRERIESLLAIRRLHQQYGHIQEIIIQNFRAKPGTKMVLHPEPDLHELLWTIAIARILFGARMAIQAPPNLSPGVLENIVAAGINDWGGVSPVTPDHVNPEAPWPNIVTLAAATRRAGKHLCERLTIYPAYALNLRTWLDEALQFAVLKQIDAEGYAREDDWLTGATEAPPTGFSLRQEGRTDPEIAAILAKIDGNYRPAETELVRLFQARGADFSRVCATADALREQAVGDTVTFAINRNINYTNICYFKCQFCAFSKGKLADDLRGKPYDLALDEIQRRTAEAWERGATEVCMQGGIHPAYNAATYLNIVKAVKQAAPEIHVHAFSPLEVWHGAARAGLSIADYLSQLRQAGLASLPGTAAEILHDEVRAELCSDKINTAQWLEIMRQAKRAGLRATATMMFGHVDQYRHWAHHLLAIRDLQAEETVFTEFVPLPFVAQSAPIYKKKRARRGPTWRECLLVHAVARIALHGQIANIQTSWVKMGAPGAQMALQCGANDLGGTLMNESITRAAGAKHGQEMALQQLIEISQSLNRPFQVRDTFYRPVSAERIQAASQAAELAPVVLTDPVPVSEKATLIKPASDPHFTLHQTATSAEYAQHSVA